jgi:hypothetical protein
MAIWHLKMQQYVQKLNPGISVKLFVWSVEIPHNATFWLVCCIPDELLFLHLA